MGLTGVRGTARAHLAGYAAGMLVESCIVRHPGAPTPDGAGGMTLGPAADVPTTCQRLPALSDSERESAGRLGIARPVVLALPAGTAVSEADEVFIGAERFVVRGVSSGTWSVRRRALCSQVA